MICENCGNDLVCEGYRYCSECLESGSCRCTYTAMASRTVCHNSWPRRSAIRSNDAHNSSEVSRVLGVRSFMGVQPTADRIMSVLAGHPDGMPADHLADVMEAEGIDGATTAAATGYALEAGAITLDWDFRVRLGSAS